MKGLLHLQTVSALMTGGHDGSWAESVMVLPTPLLMLLHKEKKKKKSFPKVFLGKDSKRLFCNRKNKYDWWCNFIMSTTLRETTSSPVERICLEGWRRGGAPPWRTLRDQLTSALNHSTFALTHLIAQDVYSCLEIPPTYSCPFRNEFYVGLIWPCINCPQQNAIRC